MIDLLALADKLERLPTLFTKEEVEYLRALAQDMEEQIFVSPEQEGLLRKALENPPEPNEALKVLLRDA